MKKLLAIAMVLCIFTVFVSSASAWITPTAKPYTTDGYAYQTDTAGKTTVAQSTVAHASATSTPNFWGVYSPASADVDIYQKGVATANTAYSDQRTKVNAYGDSPSASSEQIANLHTGTTCNSITGCPPVCTEGNCPN